MFQSEKLNDDLYCSPWERMSLSNQRTLCIFLQRLEKPISITAMDITTVGVQTMAKVNNSMYYGYKDIVLTQAQNKCCMWF